MVSYKHYFYQILNLFRLIYLVFSLKVMQHGPTYLDNNFLLFKYRSEIVN